MALLPLKNFAKQGVFPDLPPFEVPFSGLTSGENIRIHEGALSSSLGWVVARDTTPDEYTFISFWVGENDKPRFLYAGDTSIVVDEGPNPDGSASDLIDFTPAVAFTGTDKVWQGVAVGTAFILCNDQDEPLSCDEDGSQFALLPGWDGSSVSKVKKIMPFHGFLVAIGIQGYPFTVKTSGDYNPVTLEADWEISENSLADEFYLSGSTGAIVDAVAFGNHLLIFQDFGCFRMTFVGYPDLFNLQQMFATGGLIAPGCAVTFEKGVFVVGPEEIYITDGFQMMDISADRVKETFYGELGSPKSVRVYRNEKSQEITVCYAKKDDSGDTGTSDVAPSNRALVYNYKHNAFTFHDLPDIALAGRGVAFSQIYTYEDLLPEADGGNNAFDNPSYSQMGNEVYSKMTVSKGTTVTLAVSKDTKKVYQLDFGNTHEGVPIDSTFAHSKMDLMQDMETSLPIYNLTRLYAQIAGGGIISFEIGGSDTPGGPVAQVGKTNFSINDDLDTGRKAEYKLDVRTSHRYISMKGQMNTIGGFQITGLDAEVTERSRR